MQKNMPVSGWVPLPVEDSGENPMSMQIQKRKGARKFGFFVALMLFFCPVAAMAGEILDTQFSMDPARVYVNQQFRILCDLSVTFGCEVSDARFDGFPDLQDEWEITGPEVIDQRRKDDGPQRSVTVVTFAWNVRPKRAFTRTLQPLFSCSLVERRTEGFFSRWQSFPQRLRMKPFTVKVLPLPETDRPKDFKGAIGDFLLSGSLSRKEVKPGDLVLLRLSLTGSGWLGGGDFPAPNPTELFKTYPPKRTVSEAQRNETEQVWIPMTSAAKEIPAVSFSFFDPKKGVYKRLTAGPFPLVFVDSETVVTQQVKVLSADMGGSAGGGLVEGNVRVTEQDAVRYLKPLLIVGTALLLALFAFFLLWTAHPFVAALVSVLLLATGSGIAYSFYRQTRDAGIFAAGEGEARLAPAEGASVLFRMDRGEPLLPVEQAGEWMRVERRDGRRGWVKRSETKDGAVQ